MAAKACSSGKVFATDVSGFRLAAAKAQGADVTLNAKDDLAAAIRAQNEGRLADLVIVATGAMPAFKQALQCVEPGGTVLFFACPEPGIELAVPLNDFWRNEIKLMPSYGAAPYDIAEAIELIRAKGVAPEKIITHHLRLKDAGLGFKLTAEPKDSLKVIIEPHK
jgi:L-iditol 2-dehydrogenase